MQCHARYRKLNVPRSHNYYDGSLELVVCFLESFYFWLSLPPFERSRVPFVDCSREETWDFWKGGISLREFNSSSSKKKENRGKKLRVTLINFLSLSLLSPTSSSTVSLFCIFCIHTNIYVGYLCVKCIRYTVYTVTVYFSIFWEERVEGKAKAKAKSLRKDIRTNKQQFWGLFACVSLSLKYQSRGFFPEEMPSMS